MTSTSTSKARGFQSPGCRGRCQKDILSALWSILHHHERIVVWLGNSVFELVLYLLNPSPIKNGRLGKFVAFPRTCAPLAAAFPLLLSAILEGLGSAQPLFSRLSVAHIRTSEEITTL